MAYVLIAFAQSVVKPRVADLQKEVAADMQKAECTKLRRSQRAS